MTPLARSDIFRVIETTHARMDAAQKRYDARRSAVNAGTIIRSDGEDFTTLAAELAHLTAAYASAITALAATGFYAEVEKARNPT